MSFKKLEEEDFEEGMKCEEFTKKWLKDFLDIFKETLTREDRLNISPIKIDLVEGHQNIQTYKPRTPIEASTYMGAGRQEGTVPYGGGGYVRRD